MTAEAATNNAAITVASIAKCLRVMAAEIPAAFEALPDSTLHEPGLGSAKSKCPADCIGIGLTKLLARHSAAAHAAGRIY
jgi:hypothetical protein